ncbi:myb family transcription factor PHL5-like isoform X2 [Diospyros lotus]|uniref:myb family transcription factor PHL5-like isoform X2 n=1 Tax=Diospyros lotus TaxID=55363 RepID=UPI0022543F9E|nr:myb family transcription factor PHL5-like isoform X2 [Diospyros lotus]
MYFLRAPLQTEWISILRTETELTFWFLFLAVTCKMSSSHKISCQERAQLNHGFDGDQFQPFRMGTCFQEPEMEGGSQQPSFGQSNPSGTILSGLGSPVSAFYATERCMGLSQSEYQSENPPLCSQQPRDCDLQALSYQSSGDGFYFDPPDQAHPSFQSKDVPESGVKSHFGSNQNYASSERSDRIPSNNFFEEERILQLKRKLLDDLDNSGREHPSYPSNRAQDLSVFHNLYNSQFGHLRQPARPPGDVSVPLANSVPSSAAVLSSKTRIRWTQDLHDRFVECVNCLGGAEKATPKAILKLMDSDGLTIFHVKSHLQKYRIAKYMQESAQATSEKKTDMNDAEQTDAKTGMQLKEALQMQLDVQRHLHEQLERNLQLRIEEQGRQLKMMFDQQQRRNTSFFEAQNSNTTSPDDSTTSLDELQVPTADGSLNTHFPSKIS